MVRYLLFMSYIGTRYRGAAKQVSHEKILDVDSIQGAIEIGFLSLVPASLTKPLLTLSSRTDAGVHALCSTGHIELTNNYQTIYDSDSVLRWMNRYFTHSGHEIRITSFFPVKDSFNARFAAQSRTYVYRIIQAKDEDECKLPISELGRSWNLGPKKIDIEKVKAATRLFMGTKNFETFSGKDRTNRTIRYERILNELKVEDGQPVMPMDPLAKNYHYWDIVINSRSFLYNQVRRIVAVLVAVGEGILTEKDVNIMLHVPSASSWNHTIPVAPPQGLYLKEVLYDPKELALSRIREEINQIEARRKALNPTKTILTTELGDRYEIKDGVERKMKEKASPFVVDYKPDMQIAPIITGLFLSSQDPVESEELLKIYKIHHVLSLGVKASIEHEGINYYFVDFLDLPDYDISRAIVECFRLIHKYKNENILVHCNAGVSRSSTIVIAYLMANERLNYDEAYKRVKFIRNCIKPNDGFVRQLKNLSNLENMLP